MVEKVIFLDLNSFHLYNMNRQSADLPTLSHLEVHKNMTEGLVENRLNGKLHLIQAQDGKVTMDCAVCSNRKVKGGMCPRKPGLHPTKCFAIYHTMKKYHYVCS
jgi:hypothetical protein